MKKIYLLSLVLVALFLNAEAQRLEELTAMVSSPVFKWDSTTARVGKVKKDVPISVVFQFKNTGASPIIISKVAPSCGCTAAEYTKDPVYPGQEGFVKATYNAKTLGSFNKSVTVTSNIEGVPITLYLQGEVIAE